MKSKIGAVYLGPSGVGLVAQLNSLSVVIGSLAAAGLGIGAVKLIAEARESGNDTEVRRISTLLLIVPFCIGCLLVIAAVPARSMIANTFLGRRSEGDYVLIAIASVPLNLLLGSALAVIQGHQRVVRIARFSAVNALASTTVMTLLIATIGLRGAVAGILLTSFVAVSLIFALEPWLGRLPVRPRIPERASRRLMLSLGAAGLVVGLLEVGVDLALRTALVQRYGTNANGAFQPVSLLALQLFLPVVAGISAFLVPRLSALQSAGRRAEATHQVQQAVRLSILTITPVALIVIAFRYPFLRYLFSGRFTVATDAVLVQAPGQVAQAAAYVLGAVLVPTGRARTWLLFAVGVYATQLASGIALLHWYRLVALPMAFDIAWAIALIGLVYLLRFDSRLRDLAPSRASISLTAWGIATVVSASTLCAVMPSPVGEGLTVIGALAWIKWATTLAERQRATDAIRAGIGRLRQQGLFCR